MSNILTFKFTYLYATRIQPYSVHRDAFGYSFVSTLFLSFTGNLWDNGCKPGGITMANPDCNSCGLMGQRLQFAPGRERRCRHQLYIPQTPCMKEVKVLCTENEFYLHFTSLYTLWWENLLASVVATWNNLTLTIFDGKDPDILPESIA